VIDVVDAVITAQGERKMTTSIENEAAQATAAVAEKPEPTGKANARARKPHVAASKAKPGKKATPAKKSARAPKKAPKAKADGAREGSKTEKVIDLLKRPGGATAKELMKATGWQPHSVRGFIAAPSARRWGCP
jgi:hypothetical protein